jgi:hypothetical protein
VVRGELSVGFVRLVEREVGKALDSLAPLEALKSIYIKFINIHLLKELFGRYTGAEIDGQTFWAFPLAFSNFIKA